MVSEHSWLTLHIYIHTYIHTHTCSNHVSPVRVLLRDLCGRRSYNNAHTREKPGNEVSCKEQCRCTCTMCTHLYIQEKKHFIKWKKGDIGIREKAHKQDTSQTQQPHSTIITSAPTSPFQHKSRSTTTSHIQSMLLSQPLHSHPKQK